MGTIRTGIGVHREIRDDIAWISGSLGDDSVLLFLTEPYLYDNIEDSAAKLIYSTRRPFEFGNIEKRVDGVSWYSCAVQEVNFFRRSLSDSEIQACASVIGLNPATGVDRNLSSVSSIKIDGVKWTVDAAERLNPILGIRTIKKIEKFYMVQLDYMRITGGLCAFGYDVSKAGDIDLVIPIESMSQAHSIARSHIPQDSRPVDEYGLQWPLRWYTDEQIIICPFFIYGSLPLPIERLRETGDTLDSVVEICDDSLGILNMPIYFVNGAAQVLAVRPRIARGVIREGDRLKVRAPIYEVVSGSCAGMKAAVVTDLAVQVARLQDGGQYARCP